MDEAYDGSPFGEHCPKGRFSERPPAIQRCHMRQDFSGDHPLEHMIINFEDENITLETIGLLGQGGFGKVFAARSDRGDSFAVKVSSKKMTENDWKRLAEEVSLMSHFSDHPNIVKFFTAGKDDDRAYVVMEQCASRSLHDVIAARALDIPEILWIGWSLVNTISYIHSEECIHRDLKPQNLLFDLQGNLKITDFGLSSRISDTQPRKTVAGTAMYMAPALAEEVYKRLTKSSDAPSLSYGKEVDTWSIGVVMYVLLTRMNPYLDAIERKGVNGLDKEQKQLALFNAVAHAAWEWPDGWSGDRQLRQLVEKILDPNPNARSSLFQVLHDPVWNRRPKTCPDTLLQKLNLLERPFGLQPLHTITGNVLVSKKSLDPPPTDQLSRIASTEQHLRSHIMNEYQRSFEILLHQARIINLEFGQRTVVVRQEKSFRSQIQSTLWCQIQTDKEAGLPVIGSQPQVNPRALRRSVSLMSDDSQYGLSPRTSGMVTVDRKNSTRRSMTSASSINPNLIEVEYKCMNRHIMTKLTSMPHSYNGFDCNVCDRGILRISADRPAFRCYKCDYDICLKCVVSGKVKDVNYVCPSCSKKFTTTTKLQAHTLNCRGPSESPSPRRSSRMNTMLWDEETKRPSLLEVQLPLPEPESKHYDSPRSSGRATYVRTSAGGRISLGDTAVPRAEDVGHLVMNHQSANFPDVNQLGTKQRRSAKRGSLSSDESLLNGLPSPVQLPDRKQQSVRKPRSSAELPGTELFTKHGNNFSSFEPGTPPQHNDRGEIIGIAARRQSERSAEVNLIDRGVITIRADTADRPRDMMRQPRVPRSASSARSQQKPLAHSPVKRMREEYREEEVVTKSSRVETSSLPQIAGGRKNYTGPVRAPSVSGHTAQGGPPLPRRGPGAPLSPGSMTRTSYLTSAAIPSKSFVSAKPSQLSMARTGTSSNTVPRPGAASGVVSGSALGNSAGAFLALPKEAQHRKQFLDDFLSGGWVRYYSFTNEDTVVLFYCLQPGRYGAMFPTETGVGTAVLDLDSKMVLYVPCMNNESTNRSQPHPHVQTFYEEEARMLSFSEAQRYLGGVLRSIMSFVDEMARLKAEGLTPAAVHAAYIHHSNLSSVPRDTKFVYIRKVFPDPSGSFTLFRLSNLRSQVVCNAMVDIRWQSDRRHNVGQKYYVHADGSAEPFVVDQTGILSEVETVLNNSFRRS